MDRLELTPDQLAQLAALEDREPDTSDIPEVRPGNWEGIPGYGQRHLTAGQNRAPIGLRLDLDVLNWLRMQGPGVPDRINEILRREMEKDTRVATAAAE